MRRSASIGCASPTRCWAFGLRCAEWQGRFTVSGGTGRSLVVDHVGALWPAAEKLAGRPIDPLDPTVIARIEALAG